MSDLPAATDPFDLAYAEGVPGPMARSRPRRSRAQPVDLDATGTGEDEPPPMAVAFGGIVLTPWRQLEHGWVVVDGPDIVEVTKTRPRDVLTIDTDGVIMPGMIDLHGHPEYNVFAAWEPPRQYPNRFRWRVSDEYEAIVKVPWRNLTNNGTTQSVKKTIARYAETRALVGGVTAIQGASKHYPKAFEALVRNVDLWIFGSHRARSTIDIGRFDEEDARRITDGVADGSVAAHYVHLAEGRRGNQACMTEWRKFNELDLLTSATVVIHGSALDRDQLADVRDAGASLVWSPQSNLRLYGETTDIAAAKDLDLPIGLGADWLPSGSPSLLDEMRIAQRVAHAQGARATARDMVLMVTRDNARIAGLDDHLGKLRAGRPADLVVLQRRHEDGWESVMRSRPADVDMVMIGGDLVYGRSDWLGAVSDQAVYELVLAWGRPMLLDTRFGSPEPSAEVEAAARPARRLEEMRDRLVNRYPAIGPIFA